MLICFVGSPLSGKTTISRRLAVDFDMQLFSTGEYARTLGMDSKESSIMSKDLSDKFNDKINRAVMDRIKYPFVIDGFPRSQEQVSLLNGSGVPFVVVFLYASPNVVMSRVGLRNREGDIDTAISRMTSAIKLKHDIDTWLDFGPSKCKLLWTHTVTDDPIKDYQSILDVVKECI